MKCYVRPLLTLVLVSTSLLAFADPGRHYAYDRTSLGIRLGWIGAPNGFTMRKVVGNNAAFEFVAGYNGKYARRSELPPLHKGNTFIGASFAPYFLVAEGSLGVALTADFGARLNYHHYRTWNNEFGVPKITPEILGGFGMQFEFNESVELFADMHVKYFSEPAGAYVPGIESGLGLRFALN